MKRVGNLWPLVTDFGNLRRAAFRAAASKRDQRGVAGFLERLEPELFALQRKLVDATWRPAPTHSFTIRDPKTRVITVAPFCDRVVHHALIDPLEPLLDRRLCFESFSCRRGKGTHKALNHAQRMLRRHAWFLKLDVKAFFPSLSHAVVMATLARIVKDPEVLRLVERILAAHGTGEGGARGVPIGNLTSQWFANLVLGRLDHQVKQELRIPGYVRYMDDFVLFAEDKATLQAAHGWIERWLGEELSLRLKPTATQLAPASEGLPFLGIHLWRGTRRLRPANRRRTVARLATRGRQFAAGRIEEPAYLDSARSIFAHLHGTGCRAFARQLAERSCEPM